MNFNLKNLSILQKITYLVAAWFLFILATYTLILTKNSHTKRDALLIDMAGRNRMLSQRLFALSEAALSYDQEIAAKAKEELRSTVDMFTENVVVLKNGGHPPKTEADVMIDPAPAEILPKIIVLEDLVNKQATLVNNILNQPKYVAQKTEANADANMINNDIQLLNPVIKDTQLSLQQSLLKNQIFEQSQEIVKLYKEEAERKKAGFFAWVLGILLVNLVALVFTYYFIRNHIINPMRHVSSVAKILATGDFSTHVDVESNDELGDIAKSMNQFIYNITTASAFADKIGQNQLDVEYQTLGEKDLLGNSLLAMRKSLADFADKEAKRNWINEGLAKFTDIIRQTENAEKFYNNVLSNLIRYVNANQGYLYVINDENEYDHYMEIVAVYAYGKQRYLEEKKKIKYKQGLVGQAWFDKEPLYFTEIPADFVNITSGMGEATPRSIYVIPLMVNEHIYGMIEMASFEPLAAHKMEFINKLSESVASTISSVKTNERTRILLAQSQEQTEEMRAQEEEMRQNMEEMNATQAEMTRNEREMQVLIKRMQQQELQQEEQMKTLEQMQESLKAEKEKSQKKALSFREKMESLDLQLESKKAELFAQENLVKQLQARIAELEKNI